MPNYQLIKNQQLRQLLMASASIQSRPTREIQRLVLELSHLPEKEQQNVIQILEQAQKKNRHTSEPDNTAKNPVANRVNRIKDDLAKVQSIKQNFERKIRSYKENKEIQGSEHAAENLLKNI